MTKKEFVTTITEELAVSARPVFAGHGIPGNLLKQIAGRPDIIAKLVNFASGTVQFRKGKNALKKTGNFQIKAYRNYQDFAKKVQGDIDMFQGRLGDEDLEGFTPETNILTILALPDTTTGDTASDIATGKSVSLKFTTAIKKEYKVPGGFYVVIMFGDSIIRQKIQNDAKRAEKRNALKVRKQEKSAAIVKKRLAAKSKARQASLKSLTSRRDLMAAEHQQNLAALQMLGAKGTASRNINAAKKRHDAEINKALGKLTPAEMLVLKTAVREWKKGNLVKANRLLTDLTLPEVLTDFVRKGGKVYANDKLRERNANIGASMRATEQKISRLRQRATNAPNSKVRGNTNFAIRAEEAKLSKMRAAAKANRNLSKGNAGSNRAKDIAVMNAKIQQLMARGLEEQQAVKVAVQQAVIPQEQKQQIIQQVVAGVPAQQAIQEVVNVTSAGGNINLGMVEGSLLDKVKGILGRK